MNPLRFLLFSLVSLFLACTPKVKQAKQEVPKDEQILTIENCAALDLDMDKWSTLLPTEGEEAPDFTIYSLTNKAFNLKEQLALGKPILLVSGSYSCWVTRKHTQMVDRFHSKYKSFVSTFWVYTMEAHPTNMPSPYPGYELALERSEKQNDDFKVDQPLDYKTRRELAYAFQVRMGIGTPLLVDNPTNPFWKKYGQAPNAAVLIGTDGKVKKTQLWFDAEEMAETILNLNP